MSQDRATTKTAACTGVYCGAVIVVFALLTDGSGPNGSVWLIIANALIIVPVYLFVFGSFSRARMVGPWMLQPTLLKRIGAFFLSMAFVAALASLVH